MHRKTYRPSRAALTAAAVLAATAASTAAHAQAKHWNAADGSWNVGANWSPLGVPGVGNQVFIGSTAIAKNAWVTLNANASIAELTITDGMTLDSANAQLLVAGATLISGYNSDGIFGYPSRLRVANGPALTDVGLGPVEITDEGRLSLEGGVVLVAGLLDIDTTGYLSGDGLVRLTSNAATAMLVDGGLGAGMPLLTLSQEGAGRIDLDGSVAGDDTLNITLSKIDNTDFARLTIIGDALVDAMDDDIWIGGGNELTMSLTDGWTMGAGAEIKFIASAADDPPARLKGNHATLRGTIFVGGSSTEGRIDAPVTLESTVVASIGPGDLLHTTNDATIEGGSFDIGLAGSVDFSGDTLVQGGTFTTVSDDLADGGVRFDGATVYDGTLTIDGIGQQNGDATVVGPTVINATRFDLDGLDGLTSWSIANGLEVNADSIDEGSPFFNGSIEIAGGFLGKLTVNMADPGTFWVMGGSMSLGGVAAIMTVRLDGNPILFSGPLDVTNRVRADCFLRFEHSSTVTFAGPSSRLRSTEYADIWDGATFSGGQFENAPAATLKLMQGASLGSTALLNEGDLRLGAGSGPGLGFASQVTMTPTSRFFVDIGGAAPGFQHDQLQASGSVALAGTLEIDLADLGDGIFEPALDATYTILTAPLGGRSGLFANQPVSFVPGKAYVWSVGYGSTRFNDTVTVKVADIIPCPADLNGDGLIDGADLAILLGSWGPCLGCNADFDLSGMVDGADLAVLLGAWGECL
ncbi:MAG: hypothetical protein JNM94_06315 [Phycisphaerae bacterium]|nr:hypothetical protein [Phycisphaerae bacterium]